MSKNDKRPEKGTPAPPPAPPIDPDFENTVTIAATDLASDSGSGARSASGASSGSVGIAGPIPSAPTGALPDRIGRYKIIAKLGEGGMGVVYEAEQQDPKRRVALKVMRGGRLVDDGTLRMFRREAETLARLRHPNIGGIYESGHTEDGQHFFAMELVIGERLDKFLDKRPKATTPDEIRFRLQMFRRIAEAVHYAHMRGVIHRDLKPSNIIVSHDPTSDSSIHSMSGGPRLPEVKILDFGLARITENDVNATQVTEVGIIKGTLQYMAPEQARGQVGDIDVRADVYALGVVLYEMLSGAKPYDVSRSSLIEAVRVICEEPPRSLRSTISGTRRLDPDIETVVGKALQKDAEQRYVSVAAMAEDVERYLSSQPILARPPSTMYQLRKFADRHKGLVFGVAATFVVLVVGVVVSTWLALRATRAEAIAVERTQQALAAESLAKERLRDALEARGLAEERRAEADSERAGAVLARSAAEVSRERATVETEKARAINKFLQDMLATADPWAGDAGTVTLDAALERARQRIGSWAVNDPEVEVAIRGTLASAFAGVGRYTSAESLLRGGLDHLGTAKRPPLTLLAALHRQLGNIMLQTSRYGPAEGRFREALATQKRTGRAVSDTVALLMSDVAGSLAYQGRYVAADSVARAATDLVRRNGVGRAVASPSLLRTRAYIEANWRENYTRADSMLGVAVRQLSPYVADRAVETSEAVDQQAANRVQLGDMSGADSLYRLAVGIRRQALGDNHPLVARELETQGSFLFRAGRLNQSIDVQKQVLAIKQRGLGPESAPVGRSWTTLAPALAQAKRYEEADEAFTKGIAILRKTLGERHPDVASALRDFADMRIQQGRLADAEKLAREALSIRLEALGPASAGTVGSRVQVASLVRQRRTTWMYPQAETLLVTARAAAVNARGANDANAVRAAQEMVMLYDAWGRSEDATKWRAVLPAGKGVPLPTKRQR